MIPHDHAGHGAGSDCTIERLSQLGAAIPAAEWIEAVAAIRRRAVPTASTGRDCARRSRG